MDAHNDGITERCDSVNICLTLSSMDSTEVSNCANANSISSVDNTSTRGNRNSREDISFTPQSRIIPKPHELAVANCFAGDKQYDTPKSDIKNDMCETSEEFQPSASQNEAAQTTTAGSEDGNVASSPAFDSSDNSSNSGTQGSEVSGERTSQMNSDKEGNGEVSRSNIVQNSDCKTKFTAEPQLELPAVTVLRACPLQELNKGIPKSVVDVRQTQSVSNPTGVFQLHREDQGGAISMIRAPVGESTRAVSLHSLRPSHKTAEAPPTNLAFRKTDSQRFRSQDCGQKEYNVNRDRGRDDRGRDDGGHTVRLQAQLARAQSELTIERETNDKMRKIVETEVQELTDAVINDMLMDVYHKQVSVEKNKLALRHTQIDLEMREAQIKQSEIFLALGQKYLSSEVERSCAQAFSHLQIENARKQGWHDGIASHQHDQAKLDAQIIAVNIREENIALLEKNWKPQARKKMEAELRDVLWEEISERIADTEYKRGFEHGKEITQAESAENSREEGFLEGYKAARDAQGAFISVRNGVLPLNSPALDFLFNPEHPDNIFNRGIQIGRRERAQKSQDAPPPKLTMFAELHGPVPMHNGHVILANCGTESNTNAITVNSDINGPVCGNGRALEALINQSTAELCDGQLTSPGNAKFRHPKRGSLHEAGSISLSGGIGAENISPIVRTELVNAVAEYAHSNAKVERTPDLIDLDSQGFGNMDS